MRILHFRPTEAKLEEIVAEVEATRGGKVDFPEFIEVLVKNLDDSDPEQELLDAFKILDEEGFYKPVPSLHHSLTDDGTELHASCLAHHYFINVR